VVPAGARYRAAIESRTEGLRRESGLEWQVRHRKGVVLASVPVQATEEWARSGGVIPAAPEDRVLEMVLTYRRLAGTVRAEGVARFRRAWMERSH
jgi:hypothetical protein